jgi:hypothetical protein
MGFWYHVSDLPICPELVKINISEELHLCFFFFLLGKEQSQDTFFFFSVSAYR